MTYLAGTMFFFLLMLVIAIFQYLPLVTVPAVILGLLRRKNIKRTSAALLVVGAIYLFKNLEENSYGPSEIEFLFSPFQQGSVWSVLSLMGYIYLIYWWVTFLRGDKRNTNLAREGMQKEEGVKQEEKKRTKKHSLVIIGGVLVTLSIPFIWFYYPMYLKETPLLTSEPPTQSSTIEISQKGEPAFFGPAPIKVYYQRDGHPRHSIEKYVSNDGGPAQAHNIDIHWEDANNATITIMGNEGAHETIEINLLEKYHE